MKQETHYQYQKRIRELELRAHEAEEKLYSYRTSIFEIYDGLISCIKGGTGVNISWILERIRKCLK